MASFTNFPALGLTKRILLGSLTSIGLVLLVLSLGTPYLAVLLYLPILSAILIVLILIPLILVALHAVQRREELRNNALFITGFFFGVLLGLHGALVLLYVMSEFG